MHIVFDPDFDSGAWPGPLAGRDAVAGEAGVGPDGFLDQLETRLGLGGPRVSQVERIASLLAPVGQVDGFWSRSAEADAIQRVLRAELFEQYGQGRLIPRSEIGRSVQCDPEGRRVWEIEDAPRLLAVDPSTGVLFFAEPSGLVPNSFRRARLRN